MDVVQIGEEEVRQVAQALDALEEMHDYATALGGGERKVRECMCKEARAWRAARDIVVKWREQRGWGVPLRDRV